MQRSASERLNNEVWLPTQSRPFGQHLTCDMLAPLSIASKLPRLCCVACLQCKQVRFADPSGSHLSPAGEYNLRLGVMKELQPELIATHAGKRLPPRCLK
eukprot:GHRQ01027537.1.p1 GENE.GHRQ01027537.1~~GHRQ01027537.1.p1  ORF type:complete len:100 (-),score=18.45 GHRQ01027537.1:203-502(-)